MIPNKTRSTMAWILSAALVVAVLVIPNLTAASQTPANEGRLPAATPTSQPGPPKLISPANDARLPQPVPPGEWRFTWTARQGPCHSRIYIDGPGGRHIEAQVHYGASGYVYRYTTSEYIPADALKPWYWSVKVICPQGSSISETRTFSVEPPPSPTPTLTPPPPTPTKTPAPATPTPTSIPGQPVLLLPENGATLPQPVAPSEWLFTWTARPCPCTIYIDGPGGRHIQANVNYEPGGFQYHYTASKYIPPDALFPWYWYVRVNCPQGSSISETRAFSVEAPPVLESPAEK